MKQKDIKPCIGCGEGVMHAGSIAFYEITIGYRAVDVSAVKRQTGMEMMMGGNAHLAMIMGRDEDIAVNIGDDTRSLICMECAMTKSLAQLWELANENDGENDDHTET